MDVPRILHFTHSFFPVYGGTSTRNFNMMRDDRYHHVVVAPQAPCGYVPAALGTLPDRDTFSNIDVRRVALTPDWSERRASLARFLPYPVRYLLDVRARASRLLRSVNDVAADVVYGHSPLEFGLAACWYARAMRLPLVYEAHSFLADSLQAGAGGGGGLLSATRRFLARPLYRQVRLQEFRVLRAARRVIAQTPSVRDKVVRMARVPAERAIVVVNGVDVERFDPAKFGRAASPDAQPTGKREFVVMYAGFLNEINGIDFLLSAFARLRPRPDVSVRLSIAGRGPLAGQVETAARADPRISYLGLVEYDQMPALYASCDLFVVPRPAVIEAQEFYPVKLIEAMAMERLVLVSDVGGMAAIVQDDVTGFLYPAGGLERCVERIESIVSRRDSLEPIRREARAHVLDHHSWSRAHGQLANVFTEVLAGARGAR